MKRRLMIIAFIALVLLTACDQSSTGKIVGQWIMQEDGAEFGLTINADGTIFEIENGRVSNEGTWKLSNTTPAILSIYEDGKLEVEITVRFISDNEVEFRVEDEILMMKRK